MLDKEYKMEGGLNYDDARREDWMYYRNPHEYGLEDVDDNESESDKHGVWDEFYNERNYTDDDVLDDMEELSIGEFRNKI